MVGDTESNADPLAQRLRDDDLILAALKQAVAEALELHRRAGNPVAIWRDGRVVWLDPEAIEGETEPAVAKDAVTFGTLEK